MQVQSETGETTLSRHESTKRAALAGVAVVYALMSLVPSLVGITGPLSFVPIIAAGYLLGQRAGVLMAIWCALWATSGWALYSPPEAEGSTFGVVVASLVGIGAGWIIGRIHDLDLRVSERLQKRRAAEARLREAEQQSRALLEALPDYIYRIDRAGTILDFNLAEPMVQPVASEVVGRNVSETMPQRIAEQLQEATQEAISTGEVVTFEYQQSADDSGKRDYEARVVRGGEHEVIAIIRDVTSFKSLSRELDAAHHSALQAAGIKGRFLATMSHQIRTPMNGVIGMTNVLLQTKLTPDQREYTTIIRNSGEALLSILDDVLDYSKIEAGKMELEHEEFPLRSSLEEVVELLTAKAHDRGLEVASLIDARVPDWVKGDRGRLRQVITNLLGNAIKFTERGQVVLRVTVVGHERDQAMIRFDVTDTGLGISREQQKRLFQDFTQADVAIAREYGGTGLGLAISQQIVAVMGGHMAVESEPGKGSTFSFTVRFETSHGRTTGSFLLPRALSGARLIASPMHSLTRTVLEHELSPFGTHIEVVQEQAELPERIKSAGPFDLLLLELPLHATDQEVDDLVSSTAALAPNLPLAVIHGIGRRAVADVAREAGGALCLAKPLRRNALYEGLGKLLGISARKPKRDGTTETRRSMHKLRARVLVAEDNLVNQKVAVRTLEMLGCDAEVVENGALALDALQQGSYDVVLMDCQMPIMDGFEAARQIRAMEGAGLRVPIVAMTANAMQGDRERCLEAGMDDYVAKPVTVPELDAALRRWLPEQLGYRPRSAAQSLDSGADGP